MSETLKQFDHWLAHDDGPAALVIREYLMPVEGRDAVVFPPTFAASKKGEPSKYNIDRFGEDKEGTNVCLLDSVGSQANRMEPIFAEGDYANLVPQIVVQAGEKQINLLEAGHRAGDALLRCSELQEELHDAFRSLQMGDAEPLAKIAPTSLVFGVWDSRNTQAKRPRLVSSSIRAFDVIELTRSAQYNPPINYDELDVFSEEDKKKAEGDPSSQLSKRGFVHHPAAASLGGVIARSGIRREATLSIAALIQLNAGDPARTLDLRRYVLGLALVAITGRVSMYLRQGCNLVLDLDSEKPSEFREVYRDGRREPASISHDETLSFAKTAADAFGPGESRTVTFEKKRAKEDVKKKD